MDWGSIRWQKNGETRDERAQGRERDRDVFIVLHYTYKRKEMRSGSKGVVAF